MGSAAMSRYPEIDLERVRGVSLEGREAKTAREALARPVQESDSFADFWDGLPDALGAADLRALVAAILAARRAGRPVVWMFGAHVIKVGLSPLLVALLEEDLATLVAVNGAFAIHDAEMALWGRTSEDVAAGLQRGRFGMARETADLLNGAAGEAQARQEGLGEALGRILLARRERWVAPSVLGVAYDREIPVTVHVAIGCDIVHQHPSFSGAATGESTARDFRILAAHLQELSDAVVINVGSAVLLPEVFLKAFSVVTHLGASPEGLTTATLDFQRHYRPLVNVVQRPHYAGGRGIYLIGQHEILLPLLVQGLRCEQARPQES
ncbi:MAG: hypothetical protein GF330_08515 [Candidatus Eisenbacteria bacterium]|nr:hypothetical protein [Candidatus Eisenbacteria bacterium]